MNTDLLSRSSCLQLDAQNLHYGVQSLQYELQNLQYELQNLEYELQNLHYGVQNLQYELQNLHFGVQNFQYELQNLHYCVQNLKFDPQIVPVDKSSIAVQKIDLGATDVSTAIVFFADITKNKRPPKSPSAAFKYWLPTVDTLRNLLYAPTLEIKITFELLREDRYALY